MNCMRRKFRKNKVFLVLALFMILFLSLGYAAFNTDVNLKAKGNLYNKSRVIKRFDINSNEDFHSDFYKKNIVSITFLDYIDVPDGAVSFDVSESGDGGVMAYVTDNFHLYIGAYGGVVGNSDSSYLFYRFENLKEINFNGNFDTSNVVDMSFMFSLCKKLEILDLSDFNTFNVVSMQSMFNMWMEKDGTSSLTYLDISIFDTRNVTNMRDLFACLDKIVSLDVSNFNTSKVTDMWHMFYGCQSLKELNLSNFDTSSVQEFSGMFMGCTNLESLNLCSFGSNSLKAKWGIFSGMSNLNYVYMGDKWDVFFDSSTDFMNSKINKVTKGKCF